MPKNSNQAEIYLIRHAETVMNINPHLVGGRSNESPLTDRGVEQAKQLGRTLLAEQVFPTKVFVSPAIRTLETARYSLSEMGLAAKEVIVHDEIQELSQGVWEGEQRAEVYTDTVLEDIARLGKDFKLEGGESMNDVGIRMHRWMAETFSEPARQENTRYFVYTHGNAIKCLASLLQGLSHKQTYETEIGNTSISLFTGHSETWEVAYLNRSPADVKT